jgi:predicted enzyme related to lactoylglutathione lyase
MNDYDNFFLPTSNLEEVKDFFGKTLELPVKFDFSKKGMIAFQVGENEPALIFKDINRFPDAKPTIWFVVECVEKKYQELKTRGVDFLTEPFAIKTGYAAEFQDPFGNRFGITDYVNEQH